MSLEFSVVIPTYNRRETLEVVLPSLLRQTYSAARFEILLCDSGSTDGTDVLVAGLQAEFPDRLVHLVGENRGRAGARNLGLRNARGRIVLFTDADIIADPDLLRQHASMHDTSSCAVVGREVQVDTLAEYERVRIDRGVERTLHPDSRKTLSWLYFLTGNASVPRDVLVEVGGFDEEAFQGYGHEDLELGYRIRQAGLPIRYNPRAVNYHWHPVGFEEKCAKMRLAGASTVRFYQKHRDPRIKLLLGWNPLSTFLHGLLARTSWFVPLCQKMRHRFPFFGELLLQFHYLNGLKSALRESKASIPTLSKQEAKKT